MLAVVQYSRYRYKIFNREADYIHTRTHPHTHARTHPPPHTQTHKHTHTTHTHIYFTESYDVTLVKLHYDSPHTVATIGPKRFIKGTHIVSVISLLMWR